MELEGRNCMSCGLLKSALNFSKHKKNKGGLYSRCHDCCKISRKIYYDKNKNTLLKINREKRKTPEYRKKSNEQAKKYREKNKEKMLYIWAKNKCNKKNIPFNLEENDIVIPEYCPILNIKLEVGGKGKSIDNSPTLDRVDPKSGYTKGNVVVISHLANRLKTSATLEQLEKIVDYIKKHLNDRWDTDKRDPVWS